MNLHIEFEQEENGRRIAEIVELPRVLVYGDTRAEAESKVQALARFVLDRRKHDARLETLQTVSTNSRVRRVRTQLHPPKHR